MSTTEILFNSPALHSLKRAQLVQLCKRHNIKAAGKNTELVERLKQHAFTLADDKESKSLSAAAQGHAVAFLDQDKENIGDDEDGDYKSGVFDRPQRPSEMWEIVMDAIPEDDGSSSQPSTLSSKKSLSMLGTGAEFGTGGSSKSTVTSSIKAFASSLGLKRTMTADSNSGSQTSASSRKALTSSSTNTTHPRDSLLANAVPYASIPTNATLPHTEPFAFSYSSAQDTSLVADGDTSIVSLDRPIPGVGAREGVEVGGLGATAGAGTIRLITTSTYNASAITTSLDSPPKLRPFDTAFDLVPPTPGGLKAMRWPQTPGSFLNSRASKSSVGEDWKGIYPPLRQNEENDDDVDMPGSLTHPSSIPPKLNAIQQHSPPRPSADLFVFGTPHAKSKADFANAASSVLAEMNERLGLTGAQSVGIDLLAGRSGEGQKMSEEELLSYQFGGAAKKDRAKDEGSVKWRFDRAHEREFSKMDSINTHYAARRSINASKEEQEQEKLAPLPANRKRKSNALAPDVARIGHGRPSVAKSRRSSNARVISAGTRRKLGMGLPGAFGDDDDEEDEEDDNELPERQAKRARPSGAPATISKRVSLAPVPQRGDKGEDEEDEETRKEREAIKRRLEISKARRRSSRARPSVGGPRASLANQKKIQKGVNSRFGFMSAAKSLVKSVWNRGAGAPTPALPSSSAIPVPKHAPTKAKTDSINDKAPVPPTVSTKPPVPSTKKPTFSGLSADSRPSTSASGRVAAGSRTASASSQGRLNAPADLTRSGTIASTASTARSRSPIPHFNGPQDSLRSTRSRATGSSVNSYAPMRTNSSATRGSTVEPLPKRISSLGVRKSLAPAAPSSHGSTSKARPSSTLLAPTASSLAKMNSRHSVLPATTTKPRPLPVPPADASPSKIPVILPLSPRKKSAMSPPTGGTERKSIFSSPFVVQNRQDENIAAINPITGLPSPTRPGPSSPSRIPLSSTATSINQSLNPGVRRGPSVQRKPRISRSKVIAKLGAQRAASSSSSAAAVNGTSIAADDLTHHGGSSVLVARKARTRSSIGTSARIRSSMGGAGGVKAAAGLGGGARGSGVGAGAGGVLMTAKRRARASEYARRRSAKAAVAAPMPGLRLGRGEGMDVDA